MGTSLLVWVLAVGIALLPSASQPLTVDDLHPRPYFPRTLGVSPGCDGSMSIFAQQYLLDPTHESGTLTSDRAGKHLRRPRLRETVTSLRDEAFRIFDYILSGTQPYLMWALGAGRTAVRSLSGVVR